MAKVRKLDSEQATDSLDVEDEDTLSAIDEGIKAADEGRVVPEDEVRKLISQWITEFSTPNQR